MNLVDVYNQIPDAVKKTRDEYILGKKVMRHDFSPAQMILKGEMNYDNTKKLDDIVRDTKSKKNVGVRYMKSWERERELIEEGQNIERVKTEKESKRAST